MKKLTNEEQKNEVKKYDKVLPIQVNLHRPQHNVATKMENRSLYSASEIAHRADDYDIQKENKTETDLIIRSQSPGLLAFHNQVSKSNKLKNKNVRPMSNIILNPLSSTISSPLVINPKPPTSVLRQTISPIQAAQKEIEEERNSISFKEDPIAYFSKRKDGNSHLFITMNFSKERGDTDFSPYELVKVPNAEKNPEYFTMSATGVTHILPSGESEHCSLEEWASHSLSYKMIHSLRFFSQYRFWKFFRIWKNYIKRRRYEKQSSLVFSHPFFIQEGFYMTSIRVMETSCEQMIKQYLLSFWPQRKFTMKLFQTEIESNRETLIDEYHNYLSNVVEYMLELDSDIRDPTRVLITESDFTRNKSYLPNLGQLMVIHEKVEAEKNRRNEIVHHEEIGFCHFIRMVDYLLLESLSTSCYESWQIADQNVSQEMSSIFMLELYFNEAGEVSFHPTLDELLKAINDSLINSINTLDKLPRLLNKSKLRPNLREVYSLHQLLEEGPHFKEICETNSDYKTIQNHIIEVITKSYHEAEYYCQTFVEFFPLYKIGKEWSPQIYIKPRGGDLPSFDLSSSTDKEVDSDDNKIIFDPASELVVDFETVKKDVEEFIDYDSRLSQFHACSVRGALYIDSKELRGELTPIPNNSIRAIQTAINDLIQKKIEDISKIFRFCSKQLKKEPGTLEQYVNHCEFIAKVYQMDKFIKEEITFVDGLINLYETVTLSTNNHIEHYRNPVHDGYLTFQRDKERGDLIRKLNSEKFVQVLSDRLLSKEIKLQKYEHLISSYPTSIENANIEQLLPQIQRVKEKLIKLEPKIHALMRYQEVMDVRLKDLSGYEAVYQGAVFMERLYKALISFNELQNTITTVPFSNVNISDFTIEILRLRDESNGLLNMGKSNEMLDEMYEKLCRIIPLLDQLKALSESKMHYRHWKKLFEQCGQPNTYYAQIKIEELVSLGVLNEFDRIKEITSTAKGESQLETDFQAITARWSEVKIPILKSQSKSEDSLLLGDMNSLFQEIADTQISLTQMLLYPYAQGVKDSILQFSNQLEQYAKILDAWSVFQSNWVILSPFFAQDETKKILPHQTSKFSMVKRRWVSLVRHTLEDTSLVHVCSFPSLQEMLSENNKTMEILLQSSMKFIDAKREIMPRLYFMSDSEAMQLFSTTDFSVFFNRLRKMFMKIQTFRTVAQDDMGQIKESHALTFSRLRIMGLNGSSKLNFLKFVKNVQCNGPIEIWTNNLIEMMRVSLRESVLDAINTYKTTSLNEWIKMYPTSVSLLAIQTLYTYEIDECFNNFENNVHTFKEYKQRLMNKCEVLVNLLHDEKYEEYYEQISAILTAFNTHTNTTNFLCDRIPNFSQKFNWEHYLKIRIQDNKFFVDFDDVTIEHGYEFYGSAIIFIHSQASMTAQNSICNSLHHGLLPYFFGSAEVGKKDLIIGLGFLYGQYIFTIPGFVDYSQTILTRVFAGVANTGCWVVFHDINMQSLDSLTYIYDTLHEFQVPKIEGKITLKNKEYNYLKTSKIFFTGHNLLQGERMFPPQLRSMLKPVSFGAPDIETIALIRFTASRYFEGESISPRLVNMLRSIKNVFSYLPSRSVLSPTLKIINEAKSIHFFITKSESLPFMTLLDSPTLIEEFSVVYAAYKRLIIGIKREHYDVFLKFLYSYFPIFDNFDSFKYNLTQHECFEDDIREKILTETLHFIIDHNETSEILSNYLIQQTISFYNLMIRRSCIIIYGPPNSGKTQVVKLLEKAYEKILEDPEKRKYFNLLLPIKEYEIYYNYDIWNDTFGEMREDKELGEVWHCGEFQTYITNLMRYENTHDRILLLNGPLTSKFVNFLAQFAGANDSNAFQINTFDLFEYDHHFHVVIESDSISSLTPSCLNFCGLLSMENLTSKLLHPSNLDGFYLNDPEQILNRVFHDYNQPVSESLKKIILNIYPKMLTETIRFVYKTPNSLYHSESQMRTQYSEVIISDHLCYMSLLYMLNYIDISNANKNDEEQIKTIMALSAFTVFSSILDYTEISEFDNWMREKFEITIPRDWVGFEINRRFWNNFPRPSLLPLRFLDGSLLPHDCAIMDKPPIISTNPITSNVRLLSNVSICSASYLPLIFQAKVLLRQKQHFLLYGKAGCGKSTLLKFIFRDSDDVIPMVIPVSKWSTKTTLTQFINLHSRIIQKKYSLTERSKTYALIFDNLPPNNMKAIEFIRMLMATSSVPITSRKDPKYLDILQIRNFLVIVASRSLSSFPPRFIAHFCPMKLDQPSNITVNEIYHGLGKHYNINSQIVETACSFVEAFRNDEKFAFHFLSLLQPFPAYEKGEGKEKSDYDNLIKLLFCQLNLYYTHHLTTQEQTGNFNMNVQKVFSKSDDSSENKNDDEINELLTTFSNDKNVTYSEIEFNEKNLNAKILVQSFRLIQEELEFFLSGFNDSSQSEKLNLKFTPPVIRQWSLLQSALTFPGNNVLIIGKEGTGRYSLTRLIAHMNEYQFIKLDQLSDIYFYDINERCSYLMNFLSKPLKDCIFNPKPMIIYLKYNKYSDMDIEFLSHLFEFGDPTVFFTPTQLEDLYYTYGSRNGIPQDERLNMFNQICEILRINIHIVISISHPPNDESVFPLFTKIEFFSHSSEFVRETADEIFSNPKLERLRRKLPDTISNAMYEIHETIRKNYSQVSINSFYDFTDNFIHYFSIWSEEIRQRKEDGEIAVEFFSKLREESLSIKNFLEAEKPGVEKQKEEENKIQQSYVIKRDTIQSRLKKISEEENNLKNELKQLNDDLGLIRTKMNDAKVKVDLAKGKIVTLTQPAMTALLSYVDDPPAVFKYVMDLFCSMMNQPQSYGKKLFKDDNLVLIISDRIKPQSMEKATLEKAYSVSSRNKFDSRDANNVCPALSSFYDWANSLFSYSYVCYELNETQSLYDDKMSAFNKFSEGVKTERQSINQVSESLEKEYEVYQVSLEQLNSMQEKIASLEEKLKSFNQLLDGIDDLEKTWKENSENFNELENKLIGQVLTFSALLSYSGMIASKEDKEEFLKSMHEILQRNKFNDSYEQPLFFRLALAIDYKGNDQLFLDSENPIFIFTDHSVRFIEAVLRTPLIIDPDETVRNFLSRFIKKKRLMITSMASHKLDETLSDSMSEGKTLILEDVDWLHPLLLPVLQNLFYRSSNSERVGIEINGKVINIHKKFRLLLFSSKVNSKQLPNELTSRVTLIDLSKESLESTRDLFSDVFFKHFSPETIPIVGSIDRMLFQKSIQKHKLEIEFLEIISHIKNNQRNNKEYNFLNDEEVLLSLLQCKDCLFQAYRQKDPLEIQKINRSIDYAIRQFQPIIDRCFIFWEAITRFLPRIKTNKTYCLPEFIDAIHAAINSCSIKQEEENHNLTELQLADVQRTILSHLFDFIMPVLSMKEIYFLLFYIAFQIRVLNGTVNPDEFDIFVARFAEEYEGVFDMKVADVRSGDTLEQLKFSNIGSIFQIMTKFITEEFGKKFGSRFPIFSLDLFNSAPPSTPILIRMDKRDPALLFDEYAMYRNKSNFMFSISLSTETSSLKNASTVIKQACENGYWVVIHYNIAVPMIGAFLNDIMKLIVDAPSEFRLVIICHTTNCLPWSFLMKCKRFEYESFPSIRLQMLEIYQHYKSLLTSKKYDPTLRKSLYHEALLFSVVRYRMFIDPIGFFYTIPLDEPLFKPVFNYTLKSFENGQKVQSFSTSTLTRFALTLFFSGVITDEFDSLKVARYINYANESKKDEAVGQSSSKLTLDEITMNSLVPQKVIWQPHAFNDSTSATIEIKRLPHFASSETLLMEKFIANPLIQWNLSRWVTKFFTRLNFESIKRTPSNLMRAKLESLKALLPPYVNMSDLTSSSSNKSEVIDLSMLSPLSLFISCEIDDLNNSIMSIRTEIHKAINGRQHDVIDFISRDKVPKRWCSIVGFNGSQQVTRFFNFIRDRADFLTRWMKHRTFSRHSTGSINVNLVRNVYGLLLSFLNEIAEQRGSLIASNDFVCIIKSQLESDKIMNDYGPTLTLTNVWLIGGNWDTSENAFVAPTTKTLPISKMQEVLLIPRSFINESKFDENEKELLLTNRKKIPSSSQSNFLQSHPTASGVAVVATSNPSNANSSARKNEGNNGNYYDCPFYLSLPSKKFVLQNEVDLIDGKSKNLICTVRLKSKVPIENLISNGVCLVCHLPEIFAS
ncbi:hypothetical protein M9Y10_000942 [Tritrichomonas musculus]|uniref:Dynein heavy chain family protein n=1 Tax=Tritrichomonas musculus TaxID=1915356 RepID=A0ABR2L5L3_9EUKA